MTVAAGMGVMGTMFGIRWRLTVYGLDLLLRIMLVAALFKRPRRPLR
jgi:hypothetical protein